MWLQNFRFADKALSPVELLVLSNINEDTISAPGLIDRLREKMHESWEPERGTIYPVLHRLASMNLLERTDPKKLSFRRSNHGTSFLTSLQPETFKTQIEATTTYFQSIAEQLIEVNPPLALVILGEFQDTLLMVAQKLKKLEEKANEEETEWHNIPVN
jgi:DNA-binding PadR family transcriptional regulator